MVQYTIDLVCVFNSGKDELILSSRLFTLSTSVNDTLAAMHCRTPLTVQYVAQAIMH